jgi:hypothetical protein
MNFISIQVRISLFLYIGNKPSQLSSLYSGDVEVEQFSFKLSECQWSDRYISVNYFETHRIARMSHFEKMNGETNKEYQQRVDFLHVLHFSVLLFCYDGEILKNIFILLFNMHMRMKKRREDGDENEKNLNE